MTEWDKTLAEYVNDLRNTANYIEAVDMFEAEEAEDKEALAKAEEAYRRICETLEKLEDALNSVTKLVLDDILTD